MRRGSWCRRTTNGSRRLIVVAAMIEALDAIDLKLPDLTPEQQAALDAARQKLESE